MMRLHDLARLTSHHLPSPPRGQLILGGLCLYILACVAVGAIIR